MIKPAATKTEPSTRTGQVHAKWLYGAERARFSVSGTIDADDAGHRFYHWESPSVPRPCSSCRETRDADDARIDAARAQLVRTWTPALKVPAETIERLLREFNNLPRKALR